MENIWIFHRFDEETGKMKTDLVRINMSKNGIGYNMPEKRLKHLNM